MMLINKKGFTLIELLIVIALIAILAGAVIIALNPARQFASARNSQRWTHVNTMLNGVTLNSSENQGTFTCAAGVIPAVATAMTSAVGGYDICGCLVPAHFAALPADPSAAGAHFTSCADYETGYQILKAADGRVTVSAPGAEIGAAISVTQ